VSSFGHLNLTRKWVKIDVNNKNWQKMIKIIKTQKVIKSRKQKKWQNTKSDKIKNHQNTKIRKVKKWQKMIKNWPPLKKAKMSLKWHFLTLCEIRAAWLGTFWVPGGTTGPGFKAEIRPPLFSLFFDTFLLFFVICDLWILMKLMILINW